MSRIGKQPITIPEKTEVKFVDGVLTVKGPKGELSRKFNHTIDIAVSADAVTVTPAVKNLQTKALWGTYASHIKNMFEGVNTPFVKKLILDGIGYKVDVVGTTIKFALGFSHPVEMAIPAGLTVTAEKGVVTVSGVDKDLVGLFTANIRDLKRPEPYKGKGFRYEGEVIKRKQGKKAA